MLGDALPKPYAGDPGEPSDAKLAPGDATLPYRPPAVPGRKLPRSSGLGTGLPDGSDRGDARCT